MINIKTTAIPPAFRCCNYLKAQNAVDINMAKFVHDYGTIQQEANGDCEFKAKNTGKVNLLIFGCQGSCGCTVPNCLKEIILPWKTVVIKVHYNTSL